MEPVSPVVPGYETPHVPFGDHSSACILPDGTVLTRWKMTLRERLKVLFTGNIYLWIDGPGVTLEVDKPEMNPILVITSG